MNKKLFILLMMLVTITVYSKHKIGIIDYYKLLPESIFKHQKDSPEGKHIKYKFFTDHDIIKSYSVDGSIIKPIIDDKNYFLRIYDNGFNGAQASGDMQEITLFIQKKYYLLVISIYHFSIYGNSFHTLFYKYENNKLTKIKNNILPKLKLSDFFDSSVDMKRIKRFIKVKGNPIFAYNLPRYGTVIKVNIFSPVANLFEDATQQTMEDYNYFIKHVKYELELKWDKERGIFKIWKKIKNSKNPGVSEISNYFL